MNVKNTDLDRLQAAYKAAVDVWINAIRLEEQLASVEHSLAQVDLWENAHFLAEDARHTAGVAKAAYEDGLRKTFFDIE
jgi:S-adenosylmethionine hydrolase